MKATLEFNLPEEQEEFRDAVNGTKNQIILDEIWIEVFRPFYKHGYNDPKIQKLIDENPVIADEIIGYLSGLFTDLLNK